MSVFVNYSNWNLKNSIPVNCGSDELFTTAPSYGRRIRNALCPPPREPVPLSSHLRLIPSLEGRNRDVLEGKRPGVGPLLPGKRKLANKL
jgi:hypothetical protein